MANYRSSLFDKVPVKRFQVRKCSYDVITTRLCKQRPALQTRAVRLSVYAICSAPLPEPQVIHTFAIPRERDMRKQTN